LTYLTKNDLDKIDRDLESFIPTDLLRPVFLDQVLIHLLFIAEIGEKTNSIGKLDHAALSIAVNWAYEYCKPNIARNLNLDYNPENYRLALKIYHQARNYNAISGIMSLLYKGKLQGILSNNEVITELACPFDVGIAVADVTLFGSDDPTNQPPDNSHIVAYFKDLNRRKVGPMRLQYTISNTFFSDFKSLIHSASEHNWQLPATVDLGGYSLGDFRCLAETLSTFAQIHHFSSAAAPTQNLSLENIFFNSLLKASSRHNWLRILAKFSGLGYLKVKTIIADITLDSRTLGQSSRRPDLICTPFLPLTSDTLVLSNRLALEGNWERNIWKHLSILRPSTHSKISTEKEDAQIKWLNKTFNPDEQNPSIKIIPRLNVLRKTDLDLLVLNTDLKFGLAMQLKWPYGPAYFRDMQKVWEEFERGIEKLEIALNWLREHPPALIQKSGLSKQQLQDFRFEGMLLSKNSTGFGWLDYRNDIPICSDRFVRWAMYEKKIQLNRLWELASSYAFKPKENIHYTKKTITPQFGNLKFSAPIAFNLLDPFNPLTDIDW